MKIRNPFIFPNVKKPFKSRYAFVQRKILSLVGVLPDFIIIGCQKCGTTSLNNYLIKHPSIYPALRKEIGFFNDRLTKTLGWYRSHFPSVFYKNYVEKIKGRPFQTGEADPAYILDPYALQSIKQIVPNVKLILLLRNPVDRAFSHYKHTVRIGIEQLPFNEAIDAEEERIGKEWHKMLKGEAYTGLTIYHYAYLATGNYADQIDPLMDMFDKEQILILQSERLFENPNLCVNKVLSFLDLPSMKLNYYEQYNKGSYKEMNEIIRKRLSHYYRPYNEKLKPYLKEIYWE